MNHTNYIKISNPITDYLAAYTSELGKTRPFSYAHCSLKRFNFSLHIEKVSHTHITKPFPIK